MFVSNEGAEADANNHVPCWSPSTIQLPLHMLCNLPFHATADAGWVSERLTLVEVRDACAISVVATATAVAILVMFGGY